MFCRVSEISWLQCVLSVILYGVFVIYICVRVYVFKVVPEGKCFFCDYVERCVWMSKNFEQLSVTTRSQKKVVRENEDNDQSPTSSGSSASEGTGHHRLELNSDRPVAVLDQLRDQKEEEAQENVDVQETVDVQREDMVEVRGNLHRP